MFLGWLILFNVCCGFYLIMQHACTINNHRTKMWWAACQSQCLINQDIYHNNGGLYPLKNGFYSECCIFIKRWLSCRLFIYNCLFKSNKGLAWLAGFASSQEKHFYFNFKVNLHFST